MTSLTKQRLSLIAPHVILMRYLRLLKSRISRMLQHFFWNIQQKRLHFVTNPRSCCKLMVPWQKTIRNQPASLVKGLCQFSILTISTQFLTNHHGSGWSSSSWVTFYAQFERTLWVTALLQYLLVHRPPFPKSLKMSKILVDRKTATILHIFENDPKPDADYCRSVRHTSICCIVMERFVRYKIWAHMVRKQLLKESKYVCVTNRSLLTNMLYP